MRELKFRAWSEETKSFERFDLYEGTECGLTNLQIWARDTQIEQYTGLKDKNGKEIYEGDIVRCYSRKKSLGDYRVIWNEYCGGFECESLKPLVDGGDRMLKDVRVFCEIATQFRVIGNIYENADLLEEKE